MRRRRRGLRRGARERAARAVESCGRSLAGIGSRLRPVHAIVAGIVAAFALAVVAIAWFAYAATAERMAAEQRRLDIRCLAVNVYHEARGEPEAGQVAVAEVTLNRAASPRFPDSVCRVVHQEAAFSWTLGGASAPTGRAWAQAVAVATRVHDGEHTPVVPNALHYHARGIEPEWARGRAPIRTVGRHIFYP